MSALYELPLHFVTISDTEAHYTIGDIVWADVTLACDPCIPALVTYTFFNGDKLYKEIAQFSTDKVATKFAKKVAATMRRCDERNTVPHMGTFRAMVEESTGVLL